MSEAIADLDDVTAEDLDAKAKVPYKPLPTSANELIGEYRVTKNRVKECRDQLDRHERREYELVASIRAIIRKVGTPLLFGDCVVSVGADGLLQFTPVTDSHLATAE